MRVIQTVAGKLVQLSPRERQVLKYLANGEANKEIAFRLKITTSTVKGHIAAMMQVLALENRVELTAWAIAHQPAVSDGYAVDPAFVLPFVCTTPSRLGC